MIKKILETLFLTLWLKLSIAATISPWGEATLQIFDILEPNSGGLDLIVDGDTSYLAAERQGLYILDTSNLDDIKVKYHLRASDFGADTFSLYTIEKYGNYLYCGFRTTSRSVLQGYLKIVNLSNLDSTGPVVEINDIFFDARSTIGDRITGLFLSSETQELYAALTQGGLGLIDISTPSNPVLKGVFQPGAVEHQQVIVDKNNQRAYFGGWYRGIGAVDISNADPTNWTELLIDDSAESDRYWYLEQRNQYLYAPVADAPSDNTFDEGLAIYDLTENFLDPSVPPTRVGFAAIPAQYQCESADGGKDEGLVGGDPGPHQILLKDNYAIVGNGCMGVAIFDIADPNNPYFIKTYEIPGQVDYPWSVAISGDSLMTVGRNKNNTVNNDIYVFKIAPVTFSYQEQIDVSLSSVIYSDDVIIKGLVIPTNLSIKNGEYSINNGSFTNISGTINDGDSVQIRLTSSDDNNSSTRATLTIGNVSDSFKITTIDQQDDLSANTGTISALAIVVLMIIRILGYFFGASKGFRCL